jgi:plastocyanin
LVARNWLNPPPVNLRKNPALRKALRPFSAEAVLEGELMRLFRVTLLCLSGLVLLAVSRAQAQRVHDIRLEANAEKETYRFTPPLITARPGDVLRFRAGGGAPHSIVFEGSGLSEATREALNGAMSRRTGDLSSPMLTREGAEYRIVVPRVTPGIYHLYCLPHRAYDERAQLRITR